jgi:hypothetical protein
MEAGETLPFGSMKAAPATQVLQNASGDPAVCGGTTHLVIEAIELADPFSEQVRPECRRYADTAGGARLGEKENDGAE